MAIAPGATDLLVCLTLDNIPGSPTFTWNGVAVTLLSSTNNSSTTWQYRFWMSNPASGTHTAQANYSASTDGAFTIMSFLGGGGGIGSGTPSTGISGGTFTATATGLAAADMMVGMFSWNDSVGTINGSNAIRNSNSGFSLSGMNTNTGTGTVTTTGSDSNTVAFVATGLRVIAGGVAQKSGFLMFM